jgi:hypothetical protein
MNRPGQNFHYDISAMKIFHGKIHLAKTQLKISDETNAAFTGITPAYMLPFGPKE